MGMTFNKGSFYPYTGEDKKKKKKEKQAEKAKEKERNDQKLPFGKGQSDRLFIELLKSKSLWAIPCQKQFKDRKIKG